jgi:hypothetical protein
MFRTPDRSLRFDVLERHLEEAAFLWTQWEAALADAGYTLAEVAEGPEWRLRAHLDALVVAGRGAVARLLLPALEEGEPEARRAAAFVLLAEGEARDPGPVLAALAAADAEGRAALIRAFEVSESPRAHEPLLPLLAGPTPAWPRSLDALAFRRPRRRRGGPAPRPARPGCGRRLPRRPDVPGGAHPERCAGLSDPDPGVRRSALHAGLVAGQPPAFRACRDLAGQGGETGRLARAAVAVGGGAEEASFLAGLLADEALRRDALWALGFSGRLAAAEACLPFLEDEELGGVAAEAFAAIAGLPLASPFLRDPPRPREEGELPPLEEDLEADLMPGPDDDLPLLHAPRVRRWWDEARKRLDPAVRHLRGRPFDLGPIREELAGGPARRRPVLALELAIRSRGAAQVETRAFAAVQRAQQEAAGGLRGGPSFSRPFGEGA